MGSAKAALPHIDFIAEAEQCPICRADVRICKSREPTVITYTQGPFKAREVFKQCRENKSHPILGSQTLPLRVKPRQRYGYDLIVHVGLSRYLKLKQREEIRSELFKQKNIELSCGTISNLCDRFLAHFEALHLLRVPALRDAMQDGYPLHLDATCEHGKGGLFVSMDGWRQWVLVAARIPSENELYLRPLIEKTVELFGDPVATVRDLAEAGARAVKPLRDRGVPDLVCHYHFLAAVGKKLFDQTYSLLRNLLRASAVRTDQRALLRELRRYQEIHNYDGRYGHGRVREDLLALVLWVLEGNGKKDLAYPFQLPHLSFVQRNRELIERAEKWVAYPRTHTERRVIKHLRSIIARLDREQKIASATGQLEESWQLFCELDPKAIENSQLFRNNRNTKLLRRIRKLLEDETKSTTGVDQ